MAIGCHGKARRDAFPANSFLPLTTGLVFRTGTLIAGSLCVFLAYYPFLIASPRSHNPSYLYVSVFWFARFEKLKAKDTDFDVRFAHLGNLGVRNGVVTEFNWDSNLDDNSNTEHWRQVVGFCIKCTATCATKCCLQRCQVNSEENREGQIKIESPKSTSAACIEY